MSKTNQKVLGFFFFIILNMLLPTLFYCVLTQIYNFKILDKILKEKYVTYKYLFFSGMFLIRVDTFIFIFMN